MAGDKWKDTIVPARFQIFIIFQQIKIFIYYLFPLFAS